MSRLVMFASGHAINVDKIRLIQPMYSLTVAESLNVIAGITAPKDEVKINKRMSCYANVEWVVTYIDADADVEIVVGRSHVILGDYDTPLGEFIKTNWATLKLDEDDIDSIKKHFKRIHGFHNQIHALLEISIPGTEPVAEVDEFATGATENRPSPEVLQKTLDKRISRFEGYLHKTKKDNGWEVLKSSITSEVFNGMIDFETFIMEAYPEIYLDDQARSELAALPIMARSELSALPGA